MPTRKRAPSASTPTAVIDALEAIEREGGEGTLALPGRASLDVTSLGKLYYPEPRLTKGDLLRHYALVAPYLVPRMADRPLVLKRYPDGVGGQMFFQQKAPDHAPAGVRVETVRDAEGKEARRLVGGSLLTLLYTAQIGTIEVNPWHSRLGASDFADYLVIDLDPGPETRFPRVVGVARWVKETLDALGLHGALKTSGGRGLHVYVPLAARTTTESAAILAQLIATRVVEAHPRETTLERSLHSREPGAVYVDHLQNALGKSVIAAYSARARAEATVSTPLAWDELRDDLDPKAFTIRTTPARLARVGDLWGPTLRKGNAIARLLRRARA